MARFRISAPAQADIAMILAASLTRWGDARRDRYAALLAAAMRAVAVDPDGSATRDRAALGSGIRSIHLRSVRRGSGVTDPAHVVFYRATTMAIEIVRVLHERMEPATHVVKAKRRSRRNR